jgi:hypothetical protein
VEPQCGDDAADSELVLLDESQGPFRLPEAGHLIIRKDRFNVAAVVRITAKGRVAVQESMQEAPYTAGARKRSTKFRVEFPQLGICGVARELDDDRAGWPCTNCIHGRENCLGEAPLLRGSRLHGAL